MGDNQDVRFESLKDATERLETRQPSLDAVREAVRSGESIPATSVPQRSWGRVMLVSAAAVLVVALVAIGLAIGRPGGEPQQVAAPPVTATDPSFVPDVTAPPPPSTAAPTPDSTQTPPTGPEVTGGLIGPCENPLPADRRVEITADDFEAAPVQNMDWVVSLTYETGGPDGVPCFADVYSNGWPLIADLPSAPGSLTVTGALGDGVCSWTFLPYFDGAATSVAIQELICQDLGPSMPAVAEIYVEDWSAPRVVTLDELVRPTTAPIGPDALRVVTTGLKDLMPGPEIGGPEGPARDAIAEQLATGADSITVLDGGRGLVFDPVGPAPPTPGDYPAVVLEVCDVDGRCSVGVVVFTNAAPVDQPETS